MAKNDNVKDFCKDIADAIREKKGTSDLINPQDFSAEIKSISGGGSGGELEGEYYLARPNGWYWRLVKINTNVIEPNTIEWDDYTRALMPHSEVNALYDTIYKRIDASMIRKGHYDSIYGLGKQVAWINSEEKLTPFWAIAEKGPDFLGMKFSSFYEIINTQEPITEADFEAMMLEAYGLQRITKEEYESLITE